MNKKKIKKTKVLVIEKKNKSLLTFETEIIAVVRQMFIKLSDAELKVYLGVCRKYGADPIMKDIVPVVYDTRDGRTLGFTITKNHCLKVAHNSGLLDSLTSKVVKNEKGTIIGATATCWKKGSEHPFETEVTFSEYYNEKNLIWKSHPGAMIQKCAKVLVLKEAFGINLVSDIELEKNGGRMITISDIDVPVTKMIISDNGTVRTKLVEKKEVKGEVL